MKRRWHFSLLLILCLSLLMPAGSTRAQADGWQEEAQALFEEMGVQERVGQLFLVTFVGSSVTAESDITSLIRDYKVGGVMLLAENDNMTDPERLPEQVLGLTNSLQQVALYGTLVLTDTSALEDDASLPNQVVATFDVGETAVPLFISTIQDGDGPPLDQLLSGLTPLPSPMAIGATWQPIHARAAGRILGNELSVLGINMLFGPSLDVLSTPAPASQGDLGIQVYGGNPYWVGLNGQAFTNGLHEGSQGRLAVIAKHFPGYGSGDRPLNEELATIRKSLEQLRQNELLPFMTVADLANDPVDNVDGFLTTHVRFQDFQGNVSATTAPLSFDPQALGTLLQQPELAGWHQAGGLIVSDSLGANAIQGFYDDTGQEFPHRRVAKDALLAGNDLLYLSDFALGDAGYDVQLANIKDTIAWFQEKYVTDQTFQQRVDEAALRILEMKLRLYGGEFTPERVLVDKEQLDSRLGAGQAAIFDLAQDAITLLWPTAAELIEQLPPGPEDNIVIFTDVRWAQQCSTCPQQPLLGEEALEQRMLALYGPEASGQIQPGQVLSFSFAELEAFVTQGPVILAPTVTPAPTQTPDPLATPTPEGFQPTPAPTATPPAAFRVQTALETAEWIIFATLDPDPGVAASDTLSRFLAERPDIVRNKQIIVFAYNAPYYLDTTQISQLTAYFGVYGKSEPFVDASVRALFQESSLLGRPPVDVEGISYDLDQVTQPTTDQVIELFILQDELPQSPPSERPLEVVFGDTLRLQTGIIRDYNGNPVPDGTLVQFVQQDRVQGFVNVIAERPTQDGIANLDYLLEARTGNFRITANAGAARASQEVDIVIGENVTIIVITPTPAPTIAPTPTSSPTVTPSPTPTQTPIPSPTPTPVPPPVEPALRISLAKVEMLIGFSAGLLLVSVVGYFMSRAARQELPGLLRCILLALIGGLLAYNYFALSLPGTAFLHDLGGWAGLITTVLGGGVGLAIYRWSGISSQERGSSTGSR